MTVLTLGALIDPSVSWAPGPHQPHPFYQDGHKEVHSRTPLVSAHYSYRLYVKVRQVQSILKALGP